MIEAFLFRRWYAAWRWLWAVKRANVLADQNYQLVKERARYRAEIKNLSEANERLSAALQAGMAG